MAGLDRRCPIARECALPLASHMTILAQLGSDDVLDKQTIANFIEKASRLYEQERRAVSAVSPLEVYVRQWLKWARDGVSDRIHRRQCKAAIRDPSTPSVLHWTHDQLAVQLTDITSHAGEPIALRLGHLADIAYTERPACRLNTKPQLCSRRRTII